MALPRLKKAISPEPSMRAEVHPKDVGVPPKEHPPVVVVDRDPANQARSTASTASYRMRIFVRGCPGDHSTGVVSLAWVLEA